MIELLVWTAASFVNAIMIRKALNNKTVPDGARRVFILVFCFFGGYAFVECAKAAAAVFP